MDRSFIHLSAEAAAAELRNQILEKVSSLRLDSDCAVTLHAVPTTTSSNCTAAGGDRWRPSKKSNDANAATTLGAERTPPMNSKSTTVALVDGNTTADPDAKNACNGAEGSRPKQSFSALLIPSLTPLLPIRTENNNNNHQEFMPSQDTRPVINSREKKTPKQRSNYVRTPPFPAPGRDFLGREGMRTLAPIFDESSTITEDTLSLPTKAKLSVPLFESIDSGVDQQRKRARLSLPVRLAPRFTNFSTHSNSISQLHGQSQFAQDPPFLGHGSERGIDSTEVSYAIATPASKRSYVNPSLFDARTPTNHGKKHYHDAPVKNKTRQGASKANRLNQKKMLGDMFDHQLNRLAMKPQERHRQLPKRKYYSSQNDPLPCLLSSNKAPVKSENSMVYTDDDCDLQYSPIQFLFREKGKENEDTVELDFDDGAKDVEGERLLTPVATFLDEEITIGHEMPINDSAPERKPPATKAPPNIPTFGEESPFAKFERDYFK